jgi:cold shock protein
MDDRVVGGVQWFDNDRGYGFIRIEGTNKDIFVHKSDVLESGGSRHLEEGDRVEFRLEEGPKGLQAKQVIRLNIPELRADR